MTEDQLPQGVGRTALGVAMVRAVESARPASDRLFDDPYAAAFVRAAVAAAPAQVPRGRSSEAWRVMSAHLVLRTAFFDDCLQGAARTGGCTQVVLLAAGLDARAFRLDWPDGVRLFELDLPDTLAFKERVLAAEHAEPRVPRTILAVDLREDWAAALTGAGFDPEARTAWLVEGLLIYLEPADAAALLEQVGALSAPGSRLSLVHGRELRRTLELSASEPSMSAAISLWRGGLGQDAAQWLRRDGWLVHEIDKDDLADRYGADRLTHGGGFLVAERPGTGERPRRAAARLLVLDPDDHVFLQLHHDAEVGPHWVLPGGGLEPGEEPLAGALRETTEETGWTDVTTGPALWTWEHDYHRSGEGLVRQHEVIFLARAPRRDPVGDLTDSFAADGILRCRWFSPAELAEVGEVLWPPQLVALLEALRRDGPPAQPIDLAYVPNHQELDRG
ncbi:methyltransferase (TIGR00027 family) [Streptacidiphilus sp. BW17]|uniref:SAM-dependent methyltransferase n=1 Tax=Streptacidiphilus sp. BW17 TaxID=3156274 RepID=UPI0035122A47